MAILSKHPLEVNPPYVLGRKGRLDPIALFYIARRPPLVLLNAQSELIILNVIGRRRTPKVRIRTPLSPL